MFTFGGTDGHIDIYQDKRVLNTLLLKLFQQTDFFIKKREISTFYLIAKIAMLYMESHKNTR